MKVRVGVLYGGKATEHEVSIITAVQAMGYLNKDKYDVVPSLLMMRRRGWGHGLED